MTSGSKDGAPPRRLAVGVSRVTAAVMLVGVLALGVAAGGAYLLAKDIDERSAAERRQALAATIDELRALAKDPDAFGAQLVRILEHGGGLRDVKIESDPADTGRETYPLLDGRGRILGFLTWRAESAMSAAVERVLPIAAGVASGLAGLGLMALWHLRRARRRALEREQRNEDPVTHLPGPDRVRGLIEAAFVARAKEGLTLALIELDGAEDVAEHVGPRGRDELLASVAERLKKALPPEGSCGRFATYQFAVLLPSAVDAAATLRTVVEQISRPHWIDSAVKVGAHASCAEAPRDADNAKDLICRTDIALRAAKRKGPGSIVAFEPALDAEYNDAQLIKRELTGALSSQSLELHYQPIVAASGGKIVGVEALLRWTHAVRGAIPPAVFVPIAEQMGLMDELGTFVLRRALADIGRWPDLYVAINLSPLQVRDRGIVEHIRALIAEAKVAPERVVLEITEGVLIDNPEEIKARLAELRALGVRIALDDFGAGYSNLSYLQSFPFDKLKIDRGFVTSLGRSSNGGVIIQAIVALGRALGLSVLAEGVETEEQRVLLRLAGCDEMQGFRFARPAPAGAIDRLLSGPKTMLAATA